MFAPEIRTLLPLLLAATAVTGQCVSAQDTSAGNVWHALPQYEYGQDMGTLLAMDQIVITAMASSESRHDCAARLASLLVSDDTTLAARQYICLQLRQIGTAAEVPVLEQMLTKPETSEMARQALQAIPGPESTKALRGSVLSLDGNLLAGVINSLAARKDVAAVPTLQPLVDSQDQQVANAAIRALGAIADQQSTSFLMARATELGAPTPQPLAISLLQCAAQHEPVHDAASSRAIYDQLSQANQSQAVRRAALEGLLQLQGQRAPETILAWLADTDNERQLVASRHLHTLSSDLLDQLLKRLPELPAASQLTVIELAAARRGKALLPAIMSMLNSDALELRLAGIRSLGMVGDISAIPTLMDLLGGQEALSAAAQDALIRLPRKEATAALLTALGNRPDTRDPVIAVLVRIKCYDAIDPLIDIAADNNPSIYDSAVAGLRGIADPDKTDIPRLVKLLLKTEPGRHRDEVEKTILIVTQKLPEGADRSELVRAALKQSDSTQAPIFLPLLGRLGGDQSLAMIQSALKSSDPIVQEAALRALCNWPNPEVAEQLLEIAEGNQNKTFRRWALRAYIRVVTLTSDRPDAKSLAMLQSAMTLADQIDDKRLVLKRSSTVRTLDAVNWIAPYLDHPELGQAACQAIVELAHHRFLRHPNMKVFDPLLQKVGRVSEDPAIIERANRYRLGL